MHELIVERPAGVPTPGEPGLERVTYHVDAHDCLGGLSASWAAFAAANGAPHLAEGVEGRALWDFVGHAQTREIYRALLARVRAGQVLSFSYRCDSPCLRRFMRLTMTPVGNGDVRFDSVTLRTEPREALWPDQAGRTARGRMLAVCGWCKRVEVHGQWRELEAAIDQLDVFAHAWAPDMTHGMCPDCYATFSGALDLRG